MNVTGVCYKKKEKKKIKMKKKKSYQLDFNILSTTKWSRRDKEQETEGRTEKRTRSTF